MLNQLIERLLTTIYPKRCLRCDCITTNDEFCERCDPFIPISKKTCKRCGLPIAICTCKSRFYYFDEIHTVFENDGDIKDSFYRFKFRGHYVLGGYYAKQLEKLVERHYDLAEFDFITAVPTHRSTILERGYDHTAVLAKALSKGLRIPFQKTLHQVRRGVKQHLTKGIEQRFDNVRDKYRPCRGLDISDKTVLLVDDIATTGATMSACARELRLAGAKRVSAVAVLLTIPHK